MKSTNNERRTFSMEDFEKGLMLAGLISPSSVNELKEREQLEEYENLLKKENQKLYFKRMVLAAEIAWQLHQQPTFGRVKFQKLVFLCEQIVNMDLYKRYVKQVAGPFDNKFMHSIEKDFADHKWFKVEKITDGKMTRSVYKPLPGVETYKSYFNSYFSNQIIEIQNIIDLFRTAKTDTTEIAATLFACQLELRESKENVTIEKLLEKFYDWSDKKKRFNHALVLEVWNWLVDKGLVKSIN